MFYTRLASWCSVVSLFLAVFTLAVSGPAGAESTIIVKGGSQTLNDATQSIAGPPSAILNFDEQSKQAFGLEYEWQFGSGFSVGGEILHFTHDWTSGPFSSGDLRSLTFTVNGKKYFKVTDWLRPYVGVGIGFASGDFKGPGGTAGLFGLAAQAMGGVEFRFKQVGLYTEVKALTAQPEDSNSEKIDISGTGLYAGLSVHF